MYLILNHANLIICIASDTKYVRKQPNGLTVLARDKSAEAIYAMDNDTFYPLTASDWGESYHAVEVETVPDGVVPGYWYYSGKFFTTEEKQAELAVKNEQQVINADLQAAISELGAIVVSDQIKAGKMTTDQVPERWRAETQALLDADQTTETE